MLNGRAKLKKGTNTVPFSPENWNLACSDENYDRTTKARDIDPSRKSSETITDWRECALLFTCIYIDALYSRLVIGLLHKGLYRCRCQSKGIQASTGCKAHETLRRRRNDRSSGHAGNGGR